MKKVNFLCLIALGIFFSACDSDDDTWGDWAKSDAFPGDYRVLATSFQYGDTVVYIGMGYNSGLSTQDKFLKNFYKFNGKTWKNVEDFPEEGRKGAVSFVIGDTAFVGAGFRDRSSLGEKTDRYYSDFYKLNLKTGKWIKDDNDEYAKTDISDFVNDKVACKFWGGIGFELNGKGYVGTGQVDGRVSKNIYEYDPTTGQWTERTMPGDPRVGGVVFKLGGKAIICLGTDGRTNVVDVYAYGGGDDWTSMRPLQDLDGSFNDDYGKIPRSYAMAFTSTLDGPKGYICGGAGTKTAWEYRLEKDRWYEVTEFPSAMLIRVAGVAFSLNGYGYVTTGGSSYSDANDNSTWRFIPGVEEDDYNDYSVIREDK